MTTIRSEIRAIVEEASRAGKPITSTIIWGLLSRDVRYDDFVQLLSAMCKAQQLTRIPPAPGAHTGKRGRASGTYELGPAEVARGKAHDELSPFMGFREEGRLVEARAAARQWAKQGRKAA